MKKIYLSAKKFNSLQRDPVGPKTQKVWTHEFRGLGVDLGKSKKSFIYKYKSPVSEKYRIIVLDSFTYKQLIDEDMIDAVVGEHYELKNKIRAGIDPLSEKDSEKEERKLARLKVERQKEVEIAKAKKNAYTLNAAFDAYTKNRLFTDDIAKSSQNTYLRCFNTHIAPALGKMPISDITPIHIYDFLDTLNDSACNMSITVLKRIQKIAIRAGKIQAPFCFDVDKRKTAKRNRIIEDLPHLLEWLEDTTFYQSYKNAIHSQLLYGCRAHEIYGLEWSEVDFNNNIIAIDWSRVKNRRVALKQFHPLVLPLMDAMMKILEEQKNWHPKYVFPQLQGEGSCSSHDLYSILKRNGFKFSSHDVRRTVATKLRNELGASTDDIDIILDHANSTVNQSYLVGTPIEQKRKILSKWHTYLSEISSNGVTPIKMVSRV